MTSASPQGSSSPGLPCYPPGAGPSCCICPIPFYDVADYQRGGSWTATPGSFREDQYSVHVGSDRGFCTDAFFLPMLYLFAGCAYQVTLHQQISVLASECVSKRCDCLSWQHGRQHAVVLHLCPRSLYIFLGNMYLLDDHHSGKTIFQSMLEVYFATEVGILVTRAGCLPSWAEAGSGLPAGYRLDPRAQGPRHSIEGCISLLRDASVGRLQNVWIYLT